MGFVKGDVPDGYTGPIRAILVAQRQICSPESQRTQPQGGSSTAGRRPGWVLGRIQLVHGPHAAENVDLTRQQREPSREGANDFNRGIKLTGVLASYGSKDDHHGRPICRSQILKALHERGGTCQLKVWSAL
jgi:hypothetical protein